MASRGEFSSKTAFILAASGSAIGLGNIWGFPVKVASNGGGAFVFAYILLTFALAYPILMAELVIGRYAKAGTLNSLLKVSNQRMRPLAHATGYWAIFTAALILSFYTIVAGWMLSNGLAAMTDLASKPEWSSFLRDASITRDFLFCALFYLMTMWIVAQGVTAGIERWSRILMPALIVLMVLLVIYIATLPGAGNGWRVYLTPDFSQLLNPKLLIDALGQAFFSLSLGVGTMMVYGSYINKTENLPKLGASVALVDIGIAFLAGLLVIPAMYVALESGVPIYNDAGELIDGGRLIFSVLPSLFGAMGSIGSFIALVFFVLMTVAALTSSISMLEVPVAHVSEKYQWSRKKATWLTGGVVFLFSTLIVFNSALLFDSVVSFTTKFSEPLIGVLFCIFAVWVWKRTQLLNELKQGYPEIEQGMFWRIWPNYVRYVCPAIVLLVFVRSFM